MASSTGFKIKNQTNTLGSATIIAISTNTGTAWDNSNASFNTVNIFNNDFTPISFGGTPNNYICLYVCEYDNLTEVNNASWRTETFTDAGGFHGRYFLLDQEKISDNNLLIKLNSENSSIFLPSSIESVPYYDDPLNAIYYGDENNNTYPEEYASNISTINITFDENGKTNANITFTNKKLPKNNSNAKYNVLPGATLEGYDFVGWFTSASSGTKVTSNTPVIYTDRDHTLYAHWSVKKVTITLNPMGGTISPTTTQRDYNGTYGNLDSPTRSGYRFLGWFTSGYGGTKITTTGVVTSDHTIYAHWEQIDYDLLVFLGDNSMHKYRGYLNKIDASGHTNTNEKTNKGSWNQLHIDGNIDDDDDDRAVKTVITDSTLSITGNSNALNYYYAKYEWVPGYNLNCNYIVKCYTCPFRISVNLLTVPKSGTTFKATVNVYGPYTSLPTSPSADLSSKLVRSKEFSFTSNSLRNVTNTSLDGLVEDGNYIVQVTYELPNGASDATRTLTFNDSSMGGSVNGQYFTITDNSFTTDINNNSYPKQKLSVKLSYNPGQTTNSTVLSLHFRWRQTSIGGSYPYNYSIGYGVLSATDSNFTTNVHRTIGDASSITQDLEGNFIITETESYTGSLNVTKYYKIWVVAFPTSTDTPMVHTNLTNRMNNWVSNKSISNGAIDLSSLTWTSSTIDSNSNRVYNLKWGTSDGPTAVNNNLGGTYPDYTSTTGFATTYNRT